MKLTKQLKQDWLDALKSGKYVQTTGQLHSEDNKYCCLGVFCVINNKPLKYWFSSEIFGPNLEQKIIHQNDLFDNPKKDYSNVIPLIETLETID